MRALSRPARSAGFLQHDGACLKRQQVYTIRAQELCESRGGHPGPSLIVPMVSVDVKQHWTWKSDLRAQELCESRGGRPYYGPYGLCERKATLDLNVYTSQPRKSPPCNDLKHRRQAVTFH